MVYGIVLTTYKYQNVEFLLGGNRQHQRTHGCHGSGHGRGTERQGRPAHAAGRRDHRLRWRGTAVHRA